MIKLNKHDILRGLRKIDARTQDAGLLIDLSVDRGAARHGRVGAVDIPAQSGGVDEEQP